MLCKKKKNYSKIEILKNTLSNYQSMSSKWKDLHLIHNTGTYITKLEAPPESETNGSDSATKPVECISITRCIIIS